MDNLQLVAGSELPITNDRDSAYSASLSSCPVRDSRRRAIASRACVRTEGQWKLSVSAILVLWWMKLGLHRSNH
jgi:hypothetical protein